MSFPSANALIRLVAELDDLLCSREFEMAKYASNNVEEINTIPKEDLASSLQVLDVGSDVLPSHRVLGLAWNPNSDLFSSKMSLSDIDCWSRRTLL